MGNLYIADNGNNRIRKATGVGVGINEVVLKNAINVFPNPAYNYIQIHSANEVCRFSVNNSLGEVVLQINCQPTPSLSREGKSITVDISKLQAGIYFIQAKANDKVYTSKFVKE